MAKRASAWLRSGCLAVVAVLQCSAGFAQLPSTEPSTDSGNTPAAKGQSKLKLATTKPFLLEQVFEHSETWSEHAGPQISSVTRRYRDSQGRMRLEEKFTCPVAPMPGVFPCSGDSWSWIRVFNPVAGAGYWWGVAPPIAHFVLAKSMETISAPLTEDDVFGGKTGAWTPSAMPDESISPLEIKHESLGTKIFEGVRLEGALDTMTMPTGWMALSHPIERVCETWTSVDLGMVVSSECNDLRTGTTRIRLVHVDLSEPNPTLFEVPEGYKIVKDNPEKDKHHHKGSAHRQSSPS